MTERVDHHSIVSAMLEGTGPWTPGEILGIERAHRFAHMAHQGQVDKCGQPYIEHPRAVAAAVAAPPGAEAVEVVAALLHDVVEDTDVLPAWIAALFGNRVAALVDDLTRRPEETYFTYITRVVLSGNPGSIRIKIADIEHNSLPERQTPEIQGMLKNRYPKALRILKGALQ